MERGHAPLVFGEDLLASLAALGTDAVLEGGPFIVSFPFLTLTLSRASIGIESTTNSSKGLGCSHLLTLACARRQSQFVMSLPNGDKLIWISSLFSLLCQ